MAINVKDYPNQVKPSLFANATFDKFFYNFKHCEKRYRAVLDYSTKNWSKQDRIRNAELELLKAREKVENNISSDATVNAMVQRYLDTLPEGNYKKNRTSYYDRNVKPYLGSKKVSTVMPHHIQKIVDQQIKNGDSPRTAKQAIEILSPALRIARANQIMFHNPCEDVKITLPKTKKVVSDATTQLKSIYDAIMKLYVNDPFYRAFFLLALQGRRRGEIMDLQAKDVVFEHDYYILRNTKNGEEQKIFLPQNVKEAMMKFLPTDGYAFTSRVTGGRLTDVHKQIQKIKKETGDWFTLHYTRNVIVSAMAEQGIDAIYMSGALGHNDPNTITKYLTMNYLLGSKIASDMIDKAIL